MARKFGPKKRSPVVPYPARWAWWGPVHVPGGNWWAAGWTTEKIPYGPGKDCYAALLFKFIMADDVWEVAQVSYKKARWRAKDQAYKWYCKKAGKPFRSLHTKRQPVSAGLRLKRAVERAVEEEQEVEWEE